ncbi:MAG TPA: nucleotidyltransferase family protein [Phycicoccus sp.]|nr:nucleotidyltransferase family protein [Phycicoccus sp.]
MTRAVGLVLAAGVGRRMGQPKALVEDAESELTWVELTVKKLALAGCSSIFVVMGAEADEVALRLLPGARAFRLKLRRKTQVLLVDALDWEEGMGASLRAGLEAIGEIHPGDEDDPDGPDSVLITLVDLPDVGIDVYRRLLRTGRRDGTAALLRAAYNGVPGHPVRIGRDHWAGVMATARGDRGAREYFASHQPRIVECGDLATGRDIDTPADLAGANPSAERI